eukprot:4961455-Pyramimonas_sp.AAC.1
MPNIIASPPDLASCNLLVDLHPTFPPQIPFILLLAPPHTPLPSRHLRPLSDNEDPSKCC